MQTNSLSSGFNSTKNGAMPLALALLSLLLPVTAIAGPVSPLYLTAGQENTLLEVQGTNVIRSWGIPNNEYAIAVMGTVQATIGATGFLCSEYTLDGVSTGFSATFPDILGTSIYDAASDGIHIYAWDFNQNRVIRFDSNWNNPVPLFSIGGTVGDFIGITYDASNNSIWISGWNKSEIRNYSLAGQLLGSFPVAHNEITALALDPATGTLWSANRNTWGLLEEYSKSGTLLSTQYYPELSGMDVLGGEFNIVAPADTTPPTITSTAATPNVLWPPDHRMVPVTLTVDAFDDVDPAPVTRITQVTSNQPQNPSSPDWVITGPLNVNLRAERTGNAGDRTYTITVECQDASGNISTNSVDVVVPHDHK
ncbi:MAG TPA: hypothetical protein VK815_09105 [Candidatus Acidoferrales bacterium]|nr:hypothetical protein [Candidatus Acidoferrales bacterium]